VRLRFVACRRLAPIPCTTSAICIPVLAGVWLTLYGAQTTCKQGMKNIDCIRCTHPGSLAAFTFPIFCRIEEIRYRKVCRYVQGRGLDPTRALYLSLPEVGTYLSDFRLGSLGAVVSFRYTPRL
jgi:hypothetical protein